LTEQKSINAVAAPFVSSLKKELIKHHMYKDRELARSAIQENIEVFYTRTRRHSHLGGLSPERFESQQQRDRSGLH